MKNHEIKETPEVKTVSQLLAEAAQRRQSDRVSQFVELLTQDTILRNIHWIVNGSAVTASFGDRFGIEIEEEKSFEDAEEVVCDGVTYRLSLYSFGVGTDRQIVSIETGFQNNTLGQLYELARKQNDKRYASVFVMIEEYFADAKRKEAIDMLVRLYDVIKKQ